MILEVPATILQLTGVVPSLFPVWYSLCRMGVSTIAVGIAVWMIHIYQHYGVWAMGGRRKQALNRYYFNMPPVMFTAMGRVETFPALSVAVIPYLNQSLMRRNSPLTF
jgi:hypothetical protein